MNAQKTKAFRHIFLALIFLAPFIQGLYFYYQVFTFSILITIMLTILFFQVEYFKVEMSYNTYFIIAYFFLYFLTCFYGIDQGMSTIGAIKSLTYLLLYLLYTNLYDNKFKEQVLAILAYSCIGIAFVSLMSYNVPWLEELLVQKNRLGGSFQYANTYGIYAIASAIIIIRKKTKNVVDYIGVGLICATIVLTFSRSIIIIGLLTLLSVIIYETTKGITVKNSKQTKSIVLTILSITIGIIGGATLVNIYSLQNVGERLSEGLSAGEWQIRMIYYKDAINMIRQFPFGTGHLGYYYIQRAFQTGSKYFIKYVHNFVLQTALDIGIIGSILFILYFVYNLFRKQFDIYLKLVLLLFMGHAIIDFDFQFPVVFFALIFIMGISNDKLIKIKLNGKNKAIMVTMLIILSGIYLYMAIATGLAYFKSYELAYKIYPIYTDAQIKDVMQKDDIDVTTLNLCDNVISRNNYALEAHIKKRDYYYVNDFYKEGIIESEKVIALNPLNIEHVEIYSDLLIAYSEEKLKEKDYEKVIEALNIIKNLSNYLERLANKVHTHYNVKHMPVLEMTPKLLYNYKKALEIEKNLQDRY